MIDVHFSDGSFSVELAVCSYDEWLDTPCSIRMI